MAMSSKDRMTLLENYKKLLEINYSVISAHLISNLIIDLDMHADIESCPTERKKMEKLLFVLPSRGSRALPEFINAVRPNYNWIALQLESEVAKDCNSNQNNLNSQCQCVNGKGGNELDNLKDLQISAHVRAIRDLMQKSISVCRSWYLLAHTMGLDASCVTDIQREMAVNGGTPYAIHAILIAWISISGPSKATFKRLIRVLEPERINEVTEGLIELLISLQ